MLLLQVTDDRGTVTQYIAENFPYRIGRSAGANLRIEAPGVFETHASIFHLAADRRFGIQAEGESFLLRNGEPVRSAPLAVGDEITIGSIRVRINLAPPRQKSLNHGEVALWVLFWAVFAAEAAVLKAAW